MTTSQPRDHRRLLRDALDAVERLEAKLEAAERVRFEPIAIVGMACRFPGGVHSPEDYWQLLCEGVDAVSEVPADRWTAEAYRRLDPKAAEAMPPQYGGFLSEVDRFDAQFFGITPREAATMDPQQRIVLETVWKALETAGIPGDGLSGSLSGVFMGMTTSDYAQVIREADPTNLDVYFATGNAHNAAAGRVAYVLGLRGPAVAVDTACSSSLVATHFACQSLRLGDVDLAVTGGVNLILVPDPFVCFAKWGMMAPDGRCKTFDASANGFVRAEGCGVIVLKRLSDAVAAGDRILAVIRGSAVTQDGASGGLTVPNGLAQQAAIRQALAHARIDPAEVGYIEAHGTGTSLGDPIELEAIDAVLGPGRPADRPLIVGSVKTNIGHLESASGVAGLIKTVLCLQHGEIPPHLHFHAMNPKIAMRNLQVQVPTVATPWPAVFGRRVAGVSSFGFSGTNAHVVLEAAQVPARREVREHAGRPSHLLTLSARTDSALRTLAAGYAARLRGASDVEVADVCHTAAVGRAHLARRAAVVVETGEQAVSALDSLAGGRPSPSAITAAAGSTRPRVAFLFTGQGAQYVGMGRQLFETEPTFRAAMERCCRVIDPLLGCSLLSVMHRAEGDPSRLDQTGFTQPALFALEYALAEMWQAWGVTPHAVLGHSVGEYAAAVAAGAMDLEAGARLISARGRVMQSLPPGGAMAAVSARLDLVEAAIAQVGGPVSVAAVNAPDAVVVSGPADAVAAVEAVLARQGVTCQRLAVSHAFHSSLMDPILDAFEREAGGVRPASPRVPFVSNLTGRVLAGDARDAHYWRRHLREPVQFARGIHELRELGCNVFLEVGPGSTLLGLARRSETSDAARWLPSLRKGRGDWQQVLETLGRLHVDGTKIDWKAFDAPYGRARVTLPAYPFEGTRHWVADRRGARNAGGYQHQLAPFFDSHVKVASEPVVEAWEGELSLDRFPFLADHVVQGRAVFPATGYMELVLQAAAATHGDRAFCLDDVVYEKPLFLSPGEAWRLQVSLTAGPDARHSYRVSSVPAGDAEGAPWTLHTRGRITAVGDGPPPLAPEALAEIRRRCPEEVSGEAFYDLLAARGNVWGPAFRGIERVWRGPGEALALVRVPPAISGQMASFHFHPAVSDASGHAIVATIPLQPSDGPTGGAFVGGSIEETRLYTRPRGGAFWAHAVSREDADGPPNVLVGDIRLFDENLSVVSELRGARLWYLRHGERVERPEVGDWLYGLAFEPALPEAVGSVARGTWVVMADRGGAAGTLAERLSATGSRVVQVVAGQGFEASGDAPWRMRPGSREDAARLIAEAERLGGPLRGVVHLWSLDAREAGSDSVQDIEAGLSLGVLSAMPVAQALAARLSPEPARLWLVTRDAQAVQAGDRVTALTASALWGFGRALAVETPGIWGRLVDLDPAAAAGECGELLVRELAAVDRNDQVAWRAGQRFAARLTRKSGAGQAQPPSWRGDRTYLLTGGLGGLGLLFARGLVERGVRHIALVGRTPLPARDQWAGIAPDTKVGRQVAAIRALEDGGATVGTWAVDVADERAVRRWLAELKAAGWPAIGGVLHAAGTIQYRPIAEVDVAEFAAVCRSKIVGGWLLHKLLGHEPLEHFIGFSSASAVLSSPFVASYAAANAGLDALAQHRLAAGLPALSIGWGLWAGIGMAEGMSGEQLEKVATRGMGAVPAAAGLEAFDAALRVGAAHVAVMPVDWQRWRELYPSFVDAPLFQHIAAAQARQPGHGSRAADERRSLDGLGAQERLEVITSTLRGQVEAVIGLEPSSLALDQPLNRIGLDSLMSTELRARIEKEFGFAPPLVSILEGRSVNDLAAAVAAGVEASLPGAGAAAADAVGSGEDGLAAVADYSDDEVDSMLRQLLERGPETT